MTHLSLMHSPISQEKMIDYCKTSTTKNIYFHSSRQVTSVTDATIRTAFLHASFQKAGRGGTICWKMLLIPAFITAFIRILSGNYCVNLIYHRLLSFLFGYPFFAFVLK